MCLWAIISLLETYFVYIIIDGERYSNIIISNVGNLEEDIYFITYYCIVLAEL